MQWFRNNTAGPLIFLIVSDDLEWCRKHLIDEKVKDVVIASKSPSHDLALLTTCAHNIIDYGTYGLWGAFMAGGHTIALDVDDKVFHKEMSDSSNKWHVYDIKQFTKKVQVNQTSTSPSTLKS
jgi:galactoside 2-L-fucosyltransferase 1/2